MKTCIVLGTGGENHQPLPFCTACNLPEAEDKGIWPLKKVATLHLGPSGKSGTVGALVATSSTRCHTGSSQSRCLSFFNPSPPVLETFTDRFFGPIAEDLRPKCRFCSLFGCTDLTGALGIKDVAVKPGTSWKPVINRTAVGVIWVLCSLAT